MDAATRIDTTFDFRSDTPAGADPDAKSPTLRRYHRLLWSKPLPSGQEYTLIDTQRGSYLHHRSDLWEFWMTSDSVVHTYRSWTRFGLPAVVDRIDPDRVTAFARLSFTMGGMMLFPSWTGTRHVTINQDRGMRTAIADRMDLTLECIRRYYAGVESPMTKTLDRYADYFALFGDVRGFVEFFLLEDLMTPDLSAVRFHLPFDDFRRQIAAPADVEEYEQYMASSMQFLRIRNRRIDSWAAEHLTRASGYSSGASA